MVFFSRVVAASLLRNFDANCKTFRFLTVFLPNEIESRKKKSLCNLFQSRANDISGLSCNRLF